MYMIYIYICVYTVLIIILVDQEEDEGHKRRNEVRDANDGVGGVGDQVHGALILHFLMTNFPETCLSENTGMAWVNIMIQKQKTEQKQNIKYRYVYTYLSHQGFRA